ncbi:MAG: hypothetical protein ACI9SI_000147 [Polaribacter sp.]|jgi:hypothetical protein
MEEKKIRFRRTRGRKKGNPKRGIVLILLLVALVYLFMNAESILYKVLP